MGMYIGDKVYKTKSKEHEKLSPCLLEGKIRKAMKKFIHIILHTNMQEGSLDLLLEEQALYSDAHDKYNKGGSAHHDKNIFNWCANPPRILAGLRPPHMQFHWPYANKDQVLRCRTSHTYLGGVGFEILLCNAEFGGINRVSKPIS
jgi:hypothetical protein